MTINVRPETYLPFICLVATGGNYHIGIDVPSGCSSVSACVSSGTWRDVTPSTAFAQNGWNYFIWGTLSAGQSLIARNYNGQFGISSASGGKVICEYDCEHLCPDTPGTGPGPSGKICFDLSGPLNN